jgi:hypothetical protein
MKIKNLDRWVLGAEIPIKSSKRRRFTFEIMLGVMEIELKDYISKTLAYVNRRLAWLPDWSNESRTRLKTVEMFWDFLKEKGEKQDEIKQEFT